MQMRPRSVLILAQTTKINVYFPGRGFKVNFRKKCGDCGECGEKKIHRISYEYSPHSPHFLQKFTLKPRPGKYTLIFVVWANIKTDQLGIPRST